MRLIKESTRNFWKMQGENAWGIQRIINFIHGYIYYTLYDHYVVAARMTLRSLAGAPKFIIKTVIIDFFANRYHCKVLTLKDAKKLVALDRQLVIPTEESKKIIPWEIANKLILNHKDHLAIVDCPCRLERKTAGAKYCEPIHTCVFIGKTGVDFVTNHMPRMNGERATVEQVQNLIEKQHKNGRVLTLWFKDATGYRGGVLCSCCSCCCGGMEVELLARKKGIEGLKITAPSGYSVVVDKEKCKACGKCVDICPYNAKQIIKIGGKKISHVVNDLCMGCGVCVTNCPSGASFLQVDPSKGEILDVDLLLQRKNIKKSNSHQFKN